MRGLTAEVVNLDKVIDSLSSIGEAILSAAPAAAKTETEFELGLTQERVPVGATGNLKASGRTEMAENSTEEMTYAIVYGGPAGSGMGQTGDVDYAVQVHEDLEAHHENGQAKFVESVIREEMESGRAASRMGPDIVRRVGL